MGKNEGKEVFNEKVMQANFSAILYLMTEQQALIGRLLQVLLNTGLVSEGGLDKITDITDDPEGLMPTYTQLYNRFATYYLRTKKLLDDRETLDSAQAGAPSEKEQWKILNELLDSAKIKKDKDDE